MVLDEHDQKWACTSCVRGHRSAKCGHTDRWLVAVKPSGRPRTSGCDHPNPDNCDCLGIRKVLMVAIPNDKKCACTGQHTCYKGKLLHSTRVKKEEETPDIPQDVLQKRNSINEAYRVGGLPYAAQLFPDFFSTIPSINPSNWIASLPPQPQADFFMQRPDNEPKNPTNVHTHASLGENGVNPESFPYLAASSHVAANAGVLPTPQTSSCCTSPKEEIAADVHGMPLSPPAITSFHLPQQLYHRRNTPTNFGSFEHPWTQADFNDIVMQHTSQPQLVGQGRSYLDSFNCHCGEGCRCKGCLAHPFNASMQQEVGSLVPLMSPPSVVCPKTYETPDFPTQQGFQYASYPSSEPVDPPSLVSPVSGPAVIDSSNFSHFEYEVPFLDFPDTAVGAVGHHSGEVQASVDVASSNDARLCCSAPNLTEPQMQLDTQNGRNDYVEDHDMAQAQRFHNSPMSPTTLPHEWPSNAAVYTAPTHGMGFGAYQ